MRRLLINPRGSPRRPPPRRRAWLSTNAQGINSLRLPRHGQRLPFTFEHLRASLASLLLDGTSRGRDKHELFLEASVALEDRMHLQFRRQESAILAAYAPCERLSDDERERAVIELGEDDDGKRSRRTGKDANENANGRTGSTPGESGDGAAYAAGETGESTGNVATASSPVQRGGGAPPISCQSLGLDAFNALQPPAQPRLPKRERETALLVALSDLLSRSGMRPISAEDWAFSQEGRYRVSTRGTLLGVCAAV